MSVIGIDLGTTNSCVAVWRNNKVEVIANIHGSRTTPSCVAFSDEERYIGENAVQQITRNVNNTVYDVKRLIGRSFDDPVVQEDAELWPFKVVDVGGKPMIEVDYMKQKKRFAPEEISAMVLGYLKSFAEGFVGGDVKGAVITVPANFNNAQRQATMDAGKIAGLLLLHFRLRKKSIAGLNVLRIINEPTAAALAYGHSNEIRGERNILIYDLGGGTFDVSIVTLTDNKEYTVLASTGDSHLGGYKFDNLLAKYLAHEFMNLTGKNVFENKKSVCKLKLKAKEAKHMLTTSLCCDLSIDSLIGGIDLDTKLYRAPFETLCSDLFKSTLDHVTKALADSKLTKNEIDEVVLVGGSTRIPMVQDMLKEFFPGKSLRTTINADEAVAYGAAIQGAILSGDSSFKLNNIVNEISSLSLGINTRGGIMKVVVPRNTPIPFNISQSFCAHRKSDENSCLGIQILEGERSLINNNNLICSFELKDIFPAVADVKVQILITFDLDNNGILRVTAKETSTGKSNSLSIQMKEKGLSQEEIQRMTKEAEKYRDHDEYVRNYVLDRLEQRPYNEAPQKCCVS